MCPKCRGDLVEERNIALESVCEFLRYPCSNQYMGCAAVRLPGPAGHTQDRHDSLPVFLFILLSLFLNCI